MTRFLLALALLLQDRQPAPDSPAQRDAEKFFKDLFKDEYKSKSDVDKRILSQKLYAQALELKDSPARQFVAFRQSYEVALQGNALDRAELALSALKERFDVPLSALKLAILTARAKSSLEAKALAVDHLALAEEAADEEDFDSAQKAAKAGTELARKAKEAALLGKADALGKDLAERKLKFEVIRRAKDTLKTRPDDPGANLAVGRHEAFTKGAWDVGLPYLEKGGDALLKKLAQWDLAGPSRPEDQLAVADGWWEIGEKEAEPAKSSLRRRAAHWYGKSPAPDARKEQIAGRLKEAGVKPAGGKPTLGPFELDDEGAIRHWLVLGPIEKAYSAALVEDLLEGEDTVLPGAGLERRIGEKALTWTPRKFDDGRVNLAPALWPSKPNTAGYAACWIEAEADVKAVLRLGSDDGYKLWLDGAPLGSERSPRMFKWDTNSHDVTLTKGRHLLLLKVCNSQGSSEFAVRVSSKSFEVPKGLRILN